MWVCFPPWQHTNWDTVWTQAHKLRFFFFFKKTNETTNKWRITFFLGGGYKVKTDKCHLTLEWRLCSSFSCLHTDLNAFVGWAVFNDASVPAYSFTPCVSKSLHRPLTRTPGITARWRTAWLFRPPKRARTALSLRPTRASLSQPSCFGTCVGPTSSFKSLPPTTTAQGSAAVLKLWWVSYGV